MPNNVQIQINKYELNKTNAVDELTNSAKKILIANEKEFQEMQNEAWYKRLWKVITFSKDNEKRLARGITSLAKVQEITIKMLLMLSGESRQIFELIEKNRDSINGIMERLIKQKDELLSLKKILSHMRYHTRVRLSDLPVSDRERILFATGKYLIDSGITKDNDDVIKYFMKFCKALNKDDDALDYNNFKYSELSELSDKRSDLLLFNVIAEMTFLSGKQYKKLSPFKNVIAYIDLSEYKQEQVWVRINNTMKTEGKEILISGYYEDDVLEFSFDSEDVDFIEVEYNTYYPRIREIINKYSNLIIKEDCITPNNDLKGIISDFIKKEENDIIVDLKNVLAFYDFINEEGNRTQLLISISGIHWLEQGKNLIYVSYDSITEESKAIVCIPIKPRSKNAQHWIYNFIDASTFLYEKKVNKEEFTKMLNDIYNMPRNELPGSQADTIFKDITD